MGNLSKAPIEILINQVSGDEFGLFYNPKTKKINFHIRKLGVIIPGREFTTAVSAEAIVQAAGATQYKAFDIAYDDAGVIMPQVAKSVSEVCTTAGTKKVVTVTPTVLVAGKEIIVGVTTIPRLKGRPEFKDQMPLTRFYTYNTDAGATATNICDGIRAAIALDQNAAVVGSGTTTLVLTAKDAKQQFVVFCNARDNVSGVEIVGGTQADTTAGVYPVLTSEEVAINFAIKDWMFGTTPNIPVTGADYVRYRILFEQEPHYGLDGANFLTKVETEVVLYVPKAEVIKAVLPVNIMDKDGANSAYNAANQFFTPEGVVTAGTGLKLPQMLEIAFAKAGSLTKV